MSPKRSRPTQRKKTAAPGGREPSPARRKQAEKRPAGEGEDFLALLRQFSAGVPGADKMLEEEEKRRRR